MLYQSRKCYACISAIFPFLLYGVRDRREPIKTTPRPTIRLPDVTCLQQGANVAACLRFDDSDAYDEFMTHCQWMPAGDRLDTFYAWQSWNYMDTDRGILPPRVSIRNEYCAWKEWTAFRMGPFNTTGGFSWTGIGSIINHSYLTPYARLPNGQDMYAFSHYVLGNVDEQSRLMPYPPIHQHHWHITGGFSMLPDEMNNHGDSQCSELQGGVRCLSRTLPAGYAHMLQPRLLIWTEYNDVRINKSESLPSYMFIAVETVPANMHVKQIRMQLINVNLPLSMKTTRTAYQVLTHSPSIVWASGRMDWSQGTLAEAYFHGHISGLYDIWLFKGTPESVFENASMFEASHDNVVYGAKYMTRLTESVTTRATKPNAATMMCSYIRSSQYDYICDMERQGVCQTFNRKARCLLDTDTTDWVLIAFHREDPTVETYIHHAFVRVYTLANDDYAILVDDANASKESMLHTIYTHANPQTDPYVTPNMWPLKKTRYRLHTDRWRM